MVYYICNKITKTWIQISRHHWNGFLSNISHQMMIQLTLIVSRLRKKWYKQQNDRKLTLNSPLQTYQMMVRWSFCVFLILFLLYYYIFSLFLIPPNSRGSKDLSTASANKGNYCPSSRKIKEISRENARYAPSEFISYQIVLG